MIRYGEHKNTFTPDNNPEKGDWYWIDLQNMAKKTNSIPCLVEMLNINNKKNDNPKDPIPRSPEINITNNHLSYAITWFGLSAFSALLILRSKRFKSTSYR